MLTPQTGTADFATTDSEITGWNCLLVPNQSYQIDDLTIYGVAVDVLSESAAVLARHCSSSG